ncbi:hypothetical protein [Pseudomonas sp. K2I15]|uniref:hypothetical protein n=1 Tax=unclassified Pseudomonas TaxID=196821 RepID=UPI000B4C75D6|nr:hypothetical protein [Pseudomonas sp. K2I15]OWP71558.1 hypothetical protein CEC48_12460 [Pseudomonas sp. K2I15]
MKSQDIVILFKLISLDLQAQNDRVKKREFTVILDIEDAIDLASNESQSYLDHFLDLRLTGNVEKIALSHTKTWEGWEDIDDILIAPNIDSYSVRALSGSLALSKSEVSNSLNRCRDIGLLNTDRLSGQPAVRKEALLDLIKYGIRYVFPAKPGPIVRGIPTAFAAPVMAGKVMSGGDLIPVWPDAYGKSKGQEITPLYKTVPGAVKKDELLYHFLALVDAIRIGGPRETKVADAMLREWIL